MLTIRIKTSECFTSPIPKTKERDPKITLSVYYAFFFKLSFFKSALYLRGLLF
jgi:hypothetical protein